ncbi:MAG TPA: RDD family protein [Micromonospora sp.]|nr:RDD family protein [Micromonospora sp.]
MRRRLLALFLDYCVVLGWFGVLAAVFVPLHLAGFKLWSAHVDLVAFVGSVLPVWLYLILTESGAARATWGKRRAGLQVLGVGRERPHRVRIGVRNAVKLLPWQFAHFGVAPLLAGDGSETLVSPSAAWSPITAAYALLGLALAAVLIRADRAAPHDLVAGTRVGVA